MEATLPDRRRGSTGTPVTTVQLLYLDKSRWDCNMRICLRLLVHFAQCGSVYKWSSPSWRLVEDIGGRTLWNLDHVRANLSPKPALRRVLIWTHMECLDNDTLCRRSDGPLHHAALSTRSSHCEAGLKTPSGSGPPVARPFHLRITLVSSRNSLRLIVLIR
jgi:hypothetical protein